MLNFLIYNKFTAPALNASHYFIVIKFNLAVECDNAPSKNSQSACASAQLAENLERPVRPTIAS